MSFNYLQSYVKMPVRAWCYISTSLPQEQAAKNGFRGKDQVFSIM